MGDGDIFTLQTKNKPIMKTLFYFAVLLSLVSCYTFKVTQETAQPTNFDQTKVYEIRTDSTRVIARNLTVENDNFKYTDRKNQQKTISAKDIVSIKERKFSVPKTSGLVVGSAAAVGLVLLLTVDIEFDFSGLNNHF